MVTTVFLLLILAQLVDFFLSIDLKRILCGKSLNACFGANGTAHVHLLDHLKMIFEFAVHFIG